MKKLFFCCLLLVVFGLLDCATTVFGVAFLGANETNVLLVSMTEKNLSLFVGVKLFAVVLVGFFFYQAGRLSKFAIEKRGIGSYVFGTTYSFSLLALVVVVSNNLMVMAKLV